MHYELHLLHYYSLMKKYDPLFGSNHIGFIFGRCKVVIAGE